MTSSFIDRKIRCEHKNCMLERVGLAPPWAFCCCDARLHSWVIVGMSLVKRIYYAKEPLLSEDLQKLFLCGLTHQGFSSQVNVFGCRGGAIFCMLCGGIYK